jgi:oxygen-dependent protoporphyrinogen oxidase
MTARVVAVGAGVTGLAAAHRLLRADPTLDVTVLEAAEAVGGRIRTERLGDLELEAGTNAFAARKPWAVELCRELGLELTSPGATGPYVWTDRGLVPLPETALGIPADIGGLARWPGMSRGGRARALADMVKRPRRSETDESLGALARRRLGDEAAERLVQPLLGGLSAGDIDRLSVRATFPELPVWERGYGSLIHGARAARRAGASAGPMLARPSDGMDALPAALLGSVGRERVRTGAAVESVRAEDAGFVVAFEGGTVRADAVVLATPAFVSSQVLADIAPASAAGLAAIRYVTTGVVLLVYPGGTAEELPESSGFAVPLGTAPMTGVSFVSRVWPSAAFGSRAVLRASVGGEGAEDLLDAPDAEIVEAVCRHLAAILALPPSPEASAVVRWPGAMPQYEVGHLARVEAIEAALPPGIFLAGDAFRGVDVADAVRSANDAAEGVRAYLAGEDRPTEREHST